MGSQVGCGLIFGPTIEFTVTDRVHFPKYRSHALVYIDRLPEDDYRSVGILVVKEAADYELSQIVEKLEEEGSLQGCDVVVDRSIHRISANRPDRGPLLASLELRGLATRLEGSRRKTAQLQSVPVYRPTPVNVVNVRSRAPDREFICGVIR